MKGSAGVNNKKYIKAKSFDSVYKTLLTEFYVNKFRNAKELEEEYDMRPSTFSETKDKIDSAVSVEKNGNGEPITVSMITENHSIRNPFFNLYSRCNDDDSEFSLYVLFTFWSIEQIWNELSQRLSKMQASDRRIVEEAIRDAKNAEYNPTCCKKFGCEPAVEYHCDSCDSCKYTKWYKMCGQYGEYKGLTKREIVSFIQEMFSIDEDARKSANRIARKDEKTLKKKLQQMVDVGYLSFDENDRYHLNSVDLSKFFPFDQRFNKEMQDFKSRFKTFVEFFSEIRPLGEIGYRIGEKTLVDGYRSPFRFKDRYVINAINDFNIVDILFAIEHNLAVKIYEKKVVDGICVIPLQIRVSMTDGRETLIYYSPSEHSVKSIWLNLIHKAELGTLSLSAKDSKTVESECKVAREFLPYIWSSGTEMIEGGNCAWKDAIPLTRVEVELDFEKQQYLLNRLKRELQGCYQILECTEENRIKIEIIVADEEDIRVWLRAYELQVVEEGYEKVERDLVSGDIQLRTVHKSTKKEISYDWIPCTDVENPSYGKLFCPETGFAFQSYTSILQRTIAERHAYPSRIEAVIDEMTADSEKMSQDLEQKKQIKKMYADPIRIFFQGVERVLQNEDYKTILVNRQFELPLDILERNWLLEITQEPMAKLFLDAEEIELIRDYLTLDENEYVFRLKDICYCDRANNAITIDPQIFRTAMQAVIQGQIVSCEYSNNKNANNGGERYWESIYYSNRQNTFRLNAFNLVKGTFAIDRLDCVVNPCLRRETSDVERANFRQTIEQGLQYGNQLSESERKEIRLGLIGQAEETQKRLLHELSAFTISCRKGAKYTEDQAAMICQILKTQTINAGTFSCTIDGKEYTGCRLRRIGKEYINVDHVVKDAPNKVNFADVNVHAIDAPILSMPCVALYPDEWFELVITLRYPGNDYAEIVEALNAYRNVFVLSERAIPKMEKGDSKRQHSVAREIIEREEQLIGMKRRK